MKPIYALIIMLMAMIASCTSPSTSHDKLSDWTLTQQQRDSILFSHYHHYNVGYNFMFDGDSVELRGTPGNAPMVNEHSFFHSSIRRGQDFLVTEISRNPADSTADSVWLRVGSDDILPGWIAEQTLLEHSTPLDPISRFIRFFSNTHMFAFVAITLLMAVILIYRVAKRRKTHMIHFNDVPSAYPTLFAVSIATSAMLYGAIQHLQPETWEEFYFHPTLNPLGQSFAISLFLASTWLTIILLLSVMFDLGEKLPLGEHINYLMLLIVWAGILYIVITLSAKIYLGYAVWFVYSCFAVGQYLRRRRKK